MKLPLEKIEAAASTDATRPELCSVLFDKERSLLRATDGFVAATVPIDDGDWKPGDVTGAIDADAVRQARSDLKHELEAAEEGERDDIRKRGAVIEAAEGGATLWTGKYFPALDGQRSFPDIEPVFNDAPDKWDAVVALDTGTLARLAKAITTDGRVRLFLRKGNSTVYVAPMPPESAAPGNKVRTAWGYLARIKDSAMDLHFAPGTVTESDRDELKEKSGKRGGKKGKRG